MRVCFLLIAIVSVMGCSNSGRERASIAGTVTLDNRPLAEGSICFIPEGGDGPTAGAVIEQGVYRIDGARGVVVGSNRIEIRALGKSGRVLPHPVFPDQTWEETVEIVPAIYNVNSELRHDVRFGHSTINFDLLSTR